jgi:hypothetical protein
MHICFGSVTAGVTTQAMLMIATSQKQKMLRASDIINVFCPTLDLCQLVEAFAHVLHQLDVPAFPSFPQRLLC